MSRNLNLKNFAILPAAAEKLKFLARLGSFAPSSHNTQPWQFKISDNVLELRANPQRRLPASDPKDREFYLSLGAALGNLKLAVEALGLSHELQDFDPNEPRVIARFIFRDLATQSFDEETLQAILKRHNNRFPFEARAVPESFLETAQKLAPPATAAVTIISDEQTKREIQKIVTESITAAFNDRGFVHELSRWMRPSLKKYRDGMPGYNLGMPWLVSLIFPWILRHLNVSQSQKKMHMPLLEQAPVYLILSSNEDVPAGWLRVGEIFERIAIEAQKQNLKTGLLAAPIEIGEHPQKLQKVLGLAGRPQMFCRVGFTANVPEPSPRLELDEILL